MARFSESFWNPEFCNFVGFEVLCRRMQEGKQMLKDFLEFLRQRAQIQEAYGKALLKLAHTSGGREEIGSLLQSWDSFRMQTEVIGMNHVTTAMALYDEATRMQEFMEMQRERRKHAEDNVRRSQTSLKGFFRKALDSKKIFDQKSKEAEAVSNLYDIESSRTTIIAKDLEKLQQKQMKVCHSAEQANLAYKVSLELLETSRRQWEEHTEHAYNVFETLEEERIICLRNSMWVVTNLGSSSCVTEDEAFEIIRTRLEACDAQHDINSFIQNKKSGSLRPPEIDINDTSKKLPDFQHHIMSKINSIIWKPMETPTMFRKTIPTNTVTVPEETIDNHEYSTIETFTLRKVPGAPLKVLYTFRGRNDGELSLDADEKVQLVRKESKDWWEVQKQDGTKGYYPANYLEPV